jgi:hypothetical protein
MKPFIFDPLQTNPLISLEEIIWIFRQKVLDMRGDTKRYSRNILYKMVRYDETHNTWEPWKEVRDGESQYVLKGKQFNKIIPKKFSNI